MSKKLSSSSLPSQQPIALPPPPETGGTHIWNPSLGIWETVDETIQPWDERHPDNLPAAPAEQPLKDA